VFGYKDRNNNLLLGTPSARYVLTNTSADTRTPEKTELTITFADLDHKDWFTYDTVDNKYFIWINKVTPVATVPPAVPESVGRLIFMADVFSATSNNEAASAIAQTIFNNVDDVEVDILNNVITITNLTAGNVTNPTTTVKTLPDVAGIAINTINEGIISLGKSANAQVTFTVPSNLTPDYFYQIYRSESVQAPLGFDVSEIDPGDELNLIIENPITTSGIIPTSITIDDDNPEVFRASNNPLYTNALSGQGILQANDVPPIAKDIALFKNSAFYANTKTAHSLQITMLGVSAFISDTSKLIIGNSTISREYTFVGVPQVTTLTVDTKNNTTTNPIVNLYSANNDRKYFMWFDKTGTSPRPTGLEDFLEIRVDLSKYPSSILNTRRAIYDSLLSFPDFKSSDVVTVANSKITKLTSTTTNIEKIDHGLITGDKIYLYYLSAPNLNKEGEYIITKIDDDNFTIQLNQTVQDNVGESDYFITEKATVEQEQWTITNTENGLSTPATITAASGEWAVATTIPGEGEDVANQEVLLSSSTSIGISIDASARSLVKVINRDALSPVTAQYLSGPDDPPGVILLKAKSIEDDPFFLAVNDSDMKNKFNPPLPELETVTDVLFSAGSNSPAKIVAAGHGLFTGDEIYLYSPNTTPAIKGKYTVASVIPPVLPATVSSAFTVSVNITEADPATIDVFYFLAETESDNLEAPNRLYYSKIGQPEAVPSLNYLDVGPKDEPIERILALRDSLFVLKTDGIYVVSGASAPNYTLRLMSNTSVIIAPDSAAILNNNIYFLSTQGIVSVSEGADSIISRQIENLIKEVTRPNFSYRTSCFGLGYENERAYHLWLPTESPDEVATQCFRFNIFERTWTRWTIPATCGVVKRVDDKMYIGDGVRNFLLQERKNGERTDHADRNFTASFPANPFVVEGIRISSLDDVEVGDTVVQTQYVTIEFFNRLLRKLDADVGLENDYEQLLEMESGENISSKVQALNDKLVADDASGEITAFIASGDWETLRDQLNDMIDQLNETNCDSAYKNYKPAVDIIEYEAVITSTNFVKVTIKTNFDLPILEGDFEVYKHIKCEVEWQPQHFGDPSLLKQVREATVMFDQNNFYRAILSFATDLSQDFVDIPFQGRGVGYWGYGIWGTPDFYWGGEGNDAPFRTIVPAEKQRCRYMTIKLGHEEARSNFRVVGISAPVRQLSTRGYRK
jgi:hypothetical protein